VRSRRTPLSEVAHCIDGIRRGNWYLMGLDLIEHRNAA